MARKVKCVDTGEFSTNDVAFRAPNKKYYSSESAYLKFEKNKKNRELCVNKMYDLLGYKPSMIIPTFFFKKLKEYEGVGYDAVLRTMFAQENAIEWALKNKDFNSESGKVMYIMAIIENHVMDEYKKIVREERQASLLGLKADTIIIDEFVDLSTVDTTNQKGTDVSSLLGDEDWI